jgi:tetratricopeptide (TPR) repeat protein
VRDYSETEDSSIEVGRELRVDTVLEGTVQRNRDRLRVTVQLLRVDNGTPMWADTFDEDFTNIFALQDTIAERVASALVSTLTQEDRAGLSKSYTDSIDAHQLYWRGRLFMDQRDEQSLRKSIEFFEKAAQADPSYALAYAGIANAYGFIVFHGYARPADILVDLKTAATKALELDDTLAETQAVLASLKVMEQDWEGADRARRRAIELNPNYGTGHLYYAFFLTGMERHEESLEHRKMALLADPNNPVMRAAMARGYLGVGQLDRAEKQARQAIEFAPDHGFAYWHLGDLYLVQDRLDEAIQAFERSGFRWRLGYAYGVAGRREEALAILAELEEKSERGHYVSPFHRAAIYSGLGEKDRAFEWLEQAYLEKTPWLVWYRVDHTLDPLRSDPRYLDLGRRLGLLE